MSASPRPRISSACQKLKIPPQGITVVGKTAPRTAARTFADSMVGMTYTYASIDGMKNEVIVVCHPRNVGTSTTDILWELKDDVITVEPGQTRKIFVKYQDEKATRIGGKEVTLTDVTVVDGGASLAALSTTLNAKANGAELVFTNNDATVAAYVKTAIVRGRKITTYSNIEAKAVDQTSMSFYGRRTMRLNLPGMIGSDSNINLPVKPLNSSKVYHFRNAKHSRHS